MSHHPEIVNLALRRRSVRSGYLPRPVPREVTEQILRCALAAPASKNASPWSFTVVDRRDRLDALAEDVATAPGRDSYRPHDPSTGLPIPRWPSTVHESADVLREVPLAIFVENRGPFSGGRRSLLHAGHDALALSIVGYELEFAALGAAIENMWLAAIGFGLSAVFMGDVAVAEAAIGERLDIRGDLFGALALGYATSSDLQPRRSTLGEIDSEGLVRWDS